MITKHLNIRVSGKVQGVYYRASAKDKADELGIFGFVCNESDGTVYLEAEGDEAGLDQFINWCWSGPPRARVDKLDVEGGEMQRFRGFEIVRGR